MERILLFAGTTEGRELAEYLARQEISCDVCVATEYGEQLLEEMEAIHRIHRGRLDQKEMYTLIREQEISIVVDATHPYAAVVSENIRRACEEADCRYLRLLREETPVDGDCVFVDSVDEAVEYLCGTKGNILAATGSKELAKYTRIPDCSDRVFARVLSTPESMRIADELGFRGSHLICMQGPFRADLNEAMIRQTGARYLVTKESGRTGGFPEKLEAARHAGAVLVVIGRPVEAAFAGRENTQEEAASTGQGSAGTQAAQSRILSPGEVRAELIRACGVRVRRQISLIGIGMGSPDNMTIEAHRACEEADVLIGAERMLETVKDLGLPACAEYLPARIRSFLEEHPQYERAAILLSGDVGFYSGAKALMECFAGEDLHVFSGISSVVYLCGKLHTSWEDVCLTSIHGRSGNVIGEVRTHRKVFALVGKQDTFRILCADLIRYGFADVTMHAGSRLSYGDERIFSGTPAQLTEQPVGDLCAVLICNETPEPVVTHGIEDDRFIRDRVPMTKSEVRSISLSKLELMRDSIVYDVGAGTGSVSIEMALQAVQGKVYAIEKKPEAVELLRRNRECFAAANLEIIEGTAPEALADLPAPTHAFIGGSSGNMESILRLLLEKNPRVRIVVNAIALETVAETTACLSRLPVVRTDITCVNAARAREVAGYHMMMGQNPVYVISCSGAPAQEETR